MKWDMEMNAPFCAGRLAMIDRDWFAFHGEGVVKVAVNDAIPIRTPDDDLVKINGLNERSECSPGFRGGPYLQGGA